MSLSSAITGQSSCFKIATVIVFFLVTIRSSKPHQPLAITPRKRHTKCKQQNLGEHHAQRYFIASNDGSGVESYRGVRLFGC